MTDRDREAIAAAYTEAPATDESRHRKDRDRRRGPEELPVAAAAETIALDPWSARYGLETASLAPFAGEPLPTDASSRSRRPNPNAQPDVDPSPARP